VIDFAVDKGFFFREPEQAIDVVHPGGVLIVGGIVAGVLFAAVFGGQHAGGFDRRVALQQGHFVFQDIQDGLDVFDVRVDEALGQFQATQVFIGFVVSRAAGQVVIGLLQARQVALPGGAAEERLADPVDEAFFLFGVVHGIL